MLGPISMKTASSFIYIYIIYVYIYTIYLSLDISSVSSLPTPWIGLVPPRGSPMRSWASSMQRLLHVRKPGGVVMGRVVMGPRYEQPVV